MRYFATWFVAWLVFAFGFAFFIASTKAHDHKKPDGSVITWYSGTCCNDKDCHPARAGAVKVVPEGYLVWGRILVKWNDTRKQWSQDGDFHVCEKFTFGHGPQRRSRPTKGVRCLYVPRGEM